MGEHDGSWRVGGLVLTVRRLWAAAMSLLTLAAIYTLEPLLAVGPAALSLLALPGVFFAVIAVLVVMALVRLVLHALQRLRRHRTTSPDSS